MGRKPDTCDGDGVESDSVKTDRIGIQRWYPMYRMGIKRRPSKYLAFEFRRTTRIFWWKDFESDSMAAAVPQLKGCWTK